MENISHASAHLAVTTQIRQLENELGVKLFDRLGNRIHLTDAGNQFLMYAEEMLHLVERAKDHLTNTLRPQGTLRIAGIHSLCASILPQFIKMYTKEYPDVKIEITMGVVDEVLELVRKGNTDMALYMDFAEVGDDFIVAYQKENPLCFLCGGSSLFGGADKFSLECLATASFIATGKDCCYRRKMEEIFLAKGLKPSVYFETGNTEVVKKFVENDIGIAVLPEIAVRTEMHERKLVEINVLESMPKAAIRLIYHKHKWVTPAMKNFIETFNTISAFCFKNFCICSIFQSFTLIKYGII